MLSKKEQIWRHILEQALGQERVLHGEQKKIARALNVSTSTVFNALKIPRASGAIEVRGRGFRIRNIEKLLTLWATQRNIVRDIVAHTRVEGTVRAIEQRMPSHGIFGGYSAFKLRYHDAPADYDKVYMYCTPAHCAEMRKRFVKAKGAPNVFILEADEGLAAYGGVIPDSQLFADLWNLSDWYAGDFLKAVKQKIFSSP